MHMLRAPSIIFDGAEAAQAGRVHCHTLVQWLASCLQRDESVDSRGAYYYHVINSTFFLFFTSVICKIISPTLIFIPLRASSSIGSM